MAADEPSYEVLRTSDDYEIRRYPSYVVAEMTVTVDFEDAGSEAFRPLARYIGGANRAAKEIPMTAPVTQKSVEIPMTAPVTQTSTEGGVAVQFIMPESFTLETTPVPTDSRITIREVPARSVAVRRYAGFWTASRLEEAERKLRDALARDGVEVTGPLEWARFNSPFSLPFLRRNEVWLPVKTPANPARTRSAVGF